jgi:capsular polysaccharide biosynthesis protein
MLSALRRRGWVVLAAIVITTLGAFAVASTRGETYTAESTAVVTASPHSLLTPDQANTLATTYAVLIPEDGAILRAVGAALGTSAPDVQSRLSVFNPTGTALLTIDYRGISAANSIAGATAALRAVAGTDPVSSNVIPGSVGAVQAPTTATASKGVTVLVALGAIIGLALGLLLLIVWERTDPRIDRPEDLSQEVGSPASPTTAISRSGANALIARWRNLTDREPSRIALIPVTADVQAYLPEVALAFSQAQTNGAVAPQRAHTPAHLVGADDFTQPFAAVGPAVIACEVPSADLTALQRIMDCDLAVLVARRGTPRADLRELLDSLTEFGVSPKWALFVGAKAARNQAGPEAL